jgi:hypothetical protein
MMMVMMKMKMSWMLRLMSMWMIYWMSWMSCPFPQNYRMLQVIIGLNMKTKNSTSLHFYGSCSAHISCGRARNISSEFTLTQLT